MEVLLTLGPGPLSAPAPAAARCTPPVRLRRLSIQTGRRRRLRMIHRLRLRCLMMKHRLDPRSILIHP